MLNYIKVIVRRPSIVSELFSHQHSDVAMGAWRDVEYWFFDDSDHVSVNVALDKAQAFRGRQPSGTRFQTSVWRHISAAKEIPAVGEVASGMRRAA